MNKKYLISVSLMTFVIPVTGFFAENFIQNTPLTFALFARWFVFSAVGLRLFVAGIKQSTDPAFTAKEIFHINSPDSFPIVRELGFANLCFGVIGIVSFFKPEFRIPSAVASGLYYGLAGAMHFVKKPVGANETFALWTDLVIFAVLATYICIGA